MPINSKQKGKAGELSLSHYLNDTYGLTAQRTQQYCGANGNADVTGLDGIHIESKRVQKLNIEKAMIQAQTDSKATGDIPSVWHRRNHTEWLVTVSADDLISFCQRFLDNIDNSQKKKEGIATIDIEYIDSDINPLQEK